MPYSGYERYRVCLACLLGLLATDVVHAGPYMACLLDHTCRACWTIHAVLAEKKHAVCDDCDVFILSFVLLSYLQINKNNHEFVRFIW